MYFVYNSNKGEIVTSKSVEVVKKVPSKKGKQMRLMLLLLALGKTILARILHYNYT